MSTAASPVLSADQIDAFERDGVLVIPDFYSAAECDQLRARMDSMVDDFDLPEAASVFSTTDQLHAQDDYFLTSGDKIRLFFEDGAIDEEGELLVSLRDGINKVGHAMHDLDPVFSDFSRKPALATVAGQLGFVDPRLLQSMYIFKQPHIGGEVVWHTDHSFLWTEPQSVMGFWVALEEATEENGCMWCLPGSHQTPVRTRFRREGRGTTTDILTDLPYDTDTDAIPLPAQVGTLVVLHGTLAHWSAPNISDRSRHAYTLHVIEGEADYPDSNWLQRPDLALRGF